MRVNLGLIINVRGLKGEVKIESTSQFYAERYKKGNKLYLVNYQTNDEKEVTVAKHSHVSNFDYVIFEEIQDVDTANKYRGYEVETLVDDLPKLKNGSYYYYELLDCKVYDQKGAFIGYVFNIEDNSTQAIIRIKQENGNEVLVPFVKAFIIDVDIDNKKIVINKMEGLL